MQRILNKIEDWAGAKINAINKAYGGDIAKSQILQFESGQKFFLKTGSINNKMFPTEANSLNELAQSNTIKVPKVLIADPEFLLIEFIEQGQKTNTFFKVFGKQFAQMHRQKAGKFGWIEDNFIGHSPQINIVNIEQSTNWTQFYFEQRLLFQFKLAESQDLSSTALRSSFKKLENKIEHILDTDDALPSLLHGDLWKGNFLADSNGLPVIIDPAVYYGHREADLAMTKLFGGYPPIFYTSYNKVYPLAEGHEYRENIYKLYHVLNHLNLFGRTYQQQALQLIKSYL